MTNSEYSNRREALLKQLASAQSVTLRDGQQIVRRPIKDIQLAIQALDNEWQKSQGTKGNRIVRLYQSGEGK